jgi:hypothetical protein
LPVPHGAPLRLRVETQLGFKMTKWISSIEFVSDYKIVVDNLAFLLVIFIFSIPLRIRVPNLHIVF